MIAGTQLLLRCAQLALACALLCCLATGLPVRAGELIEEGMTVIKVPAPAAPTEVAPARAAEPVVDPRIKRWEVLVADLNIANTFRRWGLAAGYSVRWDADRHVLVDASGAHTGTFEEALQQVLESPGIFGGAYPLEVCFYGNSPPLARITRAGEQKQECK